MYRIQLKKVSAGLPHEKGDRLSHQWYIPLTGNEVQPLHDLPNPGSGAHHPQASWEEHHLGVDVREFNMIGVTFIG
jgi:hypothetical protein